MRRRWRSRGAWAGTARRGRRLTLRLRGWRRSRTRRRTGCRRRLKRWMSIRDGGVADGGGGGRGRSERFSSSSLCFGFGFWLWGSLWGFLSGLLLERLALGFSLGIFLGFTLGGFPFFSLSSTEGLAQAWGVGWGHCWEFVSLSLLHGVRPEFWLSREHGLRYRPLSVPCRQGIWRFFAGLRVSVRLVQQHDV